MLFIKKQSLIFIFSILLFISLPLKKAYATAAATHDVILTATIIANFTKEMAQLIETVTTLKYQLEYTKQMSNALADGEITQEMIDYIVEMNIKQCEKSAADFLAEFGIDLNSCNLNQLKQSVNQEFSFRVNAKAEEIRYSLENLAKLQKNVFEESLSHALQTRTVDYTKKLEAWKRQLAQSSSLVNQAHVSASIQISAYVEMVEVRRLLGMLVEQNALLLADSQKFTNIKE